MAASTITIDSGEWTYIDSSGIGHSVTDSQTFSMTVVDGGVSNVTYSIPVAQSVNTDDGYVIDILPNADRNNTHRSIGVYTDAGEGSAFIQPPSAGEIKMRCSVDGVIQIWKVSSITPSDADYASAGTIAMEFEDQFGNMMSIASGTNVGQAA